jgi:hypothetical protein
MWKPIVAALFLMGLQAASQEYTIDFPTDELHFSAFGGTPYFRLNPGHRQVLEGIDQGQNVVMTITVLNQTRDITLPTTGDGRRGITVRVVEERESVDGALNEVGRFWYARSLETGDVYFFGEEVDFYSDGILVNQVRLWEAGVDGAVPGILMPATFLLGARYHQNLAPTARDAAENLAMGIESATPAGSFSNCVQVLETDLLRSEESPATKTYAPAIGLVNDDDALFLTDLQLGTEGLPAGASFVPYSSHSWFPVSPGRVWLFEGIQEGQPAALRITVLDQIQVIRLDVAGEVKEIPSRVIEETWMMNGALLEVSRRFVAQCVETGDVHCLGRERDHYVNGEVAGHEGSWLAGSAGAEAGIIMPSLPAPGARYTQENAPGVVVETARNSGSGMSFTVPAGTFSNCVQMTLTSLTDTNQPARDLVFAPGVGLIRHSGMQLVSHMEPDAAGAAPMLSIQNALLFRWLISDQEFHLEASTDLETWSSVPQPSFAIDGKHQMTLPRNDTWRYYRLAAP